VELAKLFEQYGNARAPGSKRAAVGDEYQPQREFVTAINPLPVKLPKAREPSHSDATLNSNTAPPRTFKSPRVRATVGWFCLSGMSHRITNESQCVLRGDQVWASPSNMVNRLNARWADRIYSGLRVGDAGYRYMLVHIGFSPEVLKEQATVAYTYRTPHDPCVEVPPDIEAQGLRRVLRIGAPNGTIVLRATRIKVLPSTGYQWNVFHKGDNATTARLKSQRSRAYYVRPAFSWMAPSPQVTLAAQTHFIVVDSSRYPDETLKRSCDSNPASRISGTKRTRWRGNFPIEHSRHARPTNPTKLTDNTVRHLTTRSSNRVSRSVTRGPDYWLIARVEQSLSPLRHRHDRASHWKHFLEIRHHVAQRYTDPAIG
jgi:hypothetical protein